MDFFNGLSFPAAGIIPFGHLRAHTPLYYGIQYNASGSIRIRINRGREYRFSGPVCFITHPGAFFEYELDSRERHDFTYFCFTGPRVAEYLEHGLLTLPPQPITITREHQFSETLKELLRLRERGRYPEAVNLLENLLLQLRQQSETVPFIYQAAQLREIVKSICANPGMEWDFQKEAEHLNISLPHFRRIFRKFTGNSPQQYLLQRRLAQAANRLAHSDEQIGTIAAEVGFSDMFYFSHFFKKYYGIAPKKYRKEFLVRDRDHSFESPSSTVRRA